MFDIGIGAWIFNVVFVVCIFLIAYGKANEDTMPTDVVEKSKYMMLITLFVIPILVAILF